MEIRVLRYFLETAREGNMTRAAQRLFISQPTMSKQLKELERELNIYHYLIYLKLHKEKLEKCQIPNNTNNERVEVIV